MSNRGKRTRSKRNKKRENMDDKSTLNPTPRPTIIDYFKKYSKKVAYVAGILTAIYPISNYVYEYWYKQQCEEFYHIPGEYFSTSINSRILYIGCILLLLVSFCVPSIMKNHEIKQGKVNKGTYVYTLTLSIILGMEMGLLNIYNLIAIMEATNSRNIVFKSCNTWLNNHAYFVIIFIVFMGSVALAGMTIANEMSKIKWKMVKKFLSGILIIAFAIDGLLLLYGTIYKINTSIEDKTKYEVVINQDKKYVVISKLDDYALVVEYTLNDDGDYVFNTGSYQFVEKSSCIYSYIDTGHTPMRNFESY